MGAFYDEAFAGPKSVPVALNFIEDFLPHAEGDFVKVYLFGLAHWTLKDGMTHEAMAEALGMTLDEVYKAWNYWAREGLVSLTKGEDGACSVRFVQNPARKAVPALQKSYTSLEMNAALDENRALRDLFAHVEAERGGEPLSPRFRQMLFHFYDQLELPVEVIILLVQFALKSGKDSLRSMEALAARWVKEGITTYEKAEQYCHQKEQERQELEALDRALEPLEKLLGINPYGFRLSERKKMGQWLNMGFSPEMLALAKEVTMESTQGKEFVPGYMHSVLETWQKQGYRTPGDVAKGQAASKPNPRAAKKRSYELSEFERLALAKNLQFLEKKKGDSA